jgi:hypothetical protein
VTNGGIESQLYEYDEQGNVKRTYVIENGVEKTVSLAQWDHHNRKSKETDGNGNVQEWTYEEAPPRASRR